MCFVYVYATAQNTIYAIDQWIPSDNSGLTNYWRQAGKPAKLNLNRLEDKIIFRLIQFV